MKIFRHQRMADVVTALAMTAVSFAVLRGQETSSIGDDYRVPNGCLVTAIHEPVIATGKPGRLVSVPKEGDEITVDGVIARIDDEEARYALEASNYEYLVAQKQAANDVDIQYARAQAKVTEAEYQEALDAIALVRRALSPNEVRRRKFSHRRSELAVVQAIRDGQVAKLTAQAKEASLKLAQAEVDKRQIRSSVDGVVAEVFRQNGEWVSAGDPIARLVQLSKLRVEGFVESEKWAPAEVMGRTVTVEVKLARGEVQKIDGLISFVGTDIGANDEFRVWAEIENREQGGSYTVLPGMQADMVIHMQ